MNLSQTFKAASSPFVMADVDPKVMRRIEQRAGDCPVHVAQQAARAEMMLLRDVQNPADLIRRLGVDTAEACATVLEWVRARWAAADHGVRGRGRELAALDLAANDMMLSLVFTGPRSATKRNAIMRRFQENRRQRDEVLSRAPRLQAIEITTPADTTLAPRNFRAQTNMTDAATIALELMIERRELIQPGHNGLYIVRVIYAETA